MLNVKARQMNLMFLNYNCGTKNFLVADGIEGQKTKQAYKNFQRDFGCVDVDGIYGPETDGKLVAYIMFVQQLIGCVNVDGIVGPETISKCKLWQKKHGLTDDGICGPLTRNEMNNSALSWDDIEHSVRTDYNCPCCGYNCADINLAKLLDKICNHYDGRRLHMTSGCRCTKHNAKVGGVQGSRHILGKAVDFYIEGISSYQLLSYCQSLVNNGEARYTYTNNTKMNGVVHIDIY